MQSGQTHWTRKAYNQASLCSSSRGFPPYLILVPVVVLLKSSVRFALLVGKWRGIVVASIHDNKPSRKGLCSIKCSRDACISVLTISDS